MKISIFTSYCLNLDYFSATLTIKALKCNKGFSRKKNSPRKEKCTYSLFAENYLSLRGAFFCQPFFCAFGGQKGEFCSLASQMATLLTMPCRLVYGATTRRDALSPEADGTSMLIPCLAYGFTFALIYLFEVKVGVNTQSPLHCCACASICSLRFIKNSVCEGTIKI